MRREEALRSNTWALPLALLVVAALSVCVVFEYRTINKLSQRVKALENNEYVQELEAHVQKLGSHVLEAIRRERAVQNGATVKKDKKTPPKTTVIIFGAF